MKEITFCLMTCGEETEAECLKAVEPLLDRVEFQEVRNVCPQVKALNQMLAQAQTPYLVPLDADMILNPDIYDRLKMALDKYVYDPQWHTILFNLYDTLTEREILALKLLRTDIVKRFPFSDTPTPDVEHFRRLTDAGYTCITTYLGKGSVGKHVVRGKHFCYNKYRDVYLTLRTHGFEWDSGVFMGGLTTLEKSKHHFNYFLYKWLTTGNEDYLYCIAGMADGLTAQPDGKSKSLERRAFAVPRDRAVHEYFEWLLPQLWSTLFF